jgi:hypothetical protein
VKVLYATTDDYIMSVSLQHGYIAYTFGIYITIYRINITESRPIAVQKIMETHEHRARYLEFQVIIRISIISFVVALKVFNSYC